MSLLVAEKELDLRVNIPANFPLIVADRQKLDLILMNLLHNAIKFTPPHGQIALEANVQGNQTLMSISDTGIGIPKNELNRIFDRFYQVEKSLTREYGGIGLGLAIARGMVEVCGGEIYVESEPGQGTTFSFTLPLDNTHLGERILKLT